MEIKFIDPVPVVPRDMVGYTDAGFVILNPVNDANRGDVKSHLGRLPLCTICIVKNNQAISFPGGEDATLHDINGKWYLKLASQDSEIKLLELNCFFEIGDCK